MVRTDSRSVYGHVITKFSGMGRFTYSWCSARARESSTIIHTVTVFTRLKLTGGSKLANRRRLLPPLQNFRVVLPTKNDREKEKVGGTPAKLNEKKGDIDLEREMKKKGYIFCWKNNMKIL